MTTTAGQRTIWAQDETHLAPSAYDAAILAATDDAIVATDRVDRIIRWSRGAEDLFGYSSAEAIGQPAALLVPPELEEERARLLGRLRGGEGIGRLEMACRHKDGQLIDVSLSAAPIMDADGRFMGAAAVVRDISARRWAERELEARARQQAALAELGQHALGGGDLTGLMDEAADLVARTLDVQFCAVMELLPEENGLRIRSNAGWGPNRTGLLVGVGPGSQAGYTLALGAPVVFEDLAAETRFHSPPIFYEQGVVSGLSVVIPGRPRPFGVMGAQSARRRRFTTDDIHFLESVANVLAAAIERHATEAQLREREAQYRAIFEATTDGLAIVNLDGLIVEANPALCQMLGYSYEELISRHVSTVLHPEDAAIHADDVRAVRAGETNSSRARLFRKDGTTLIGGGQGRHFLYRGAPHILSVMRDITTEVQAYELLEQRVAERTRELSTLLEVSHTVASTLELEPLLGLILDQLRTVVDYTGASITTHDAHSLQILDYRGHLPRERMVGLRVPLTQAPAYREVLRRNGPVLVGDLTSDEPEARVFRAAPNANLQDTVSYVRSMLGVPLRVKERVIGAVWIDHRQPHAFSERQAALVLAIANQAAVAIENAHLYARAQEAAALEERQRLARELHDSVSQAIYGVTMYAEAAATLLARGDREATAGYLHEVCATAQEALAEMRLLIFELRPPILAQEGLAAALQARLAAVEGRVTGLEASLEVEGTGRLPEGVEGALYGIAVETLNNVFKHAGAHAVKVALRQEGRKVALEIADDGAGFDPAAVQGRGGLGLGGMAERAAQIGGRLTVESVPGQGTRVRVEVEA
jgi:PAS domain S-box-containing protein